MSETVKLTVYADKRIADAQREGREAAARIIAAVYTPSRRAISQENPNG